MSRTRKMALSKKLGTKQVVLLRIPAEKYARSLTEIASLLAGKSVCYVTLNKTADALRELFKKEKIKVNAFVFVDAITPSITDTKDKKDCFYVSSPGALTELSITLSKILKHNFQYILFDSLSTIEIYASEKYIARFLQALVNTIKKTETKALFYVLNNKEETTAQKYDLFVDEVVHY